MTKQKKYLLLCVVSALVSSGAYALDKIEALEIVETTTACGDNCIEWQLKGLCFWLKCSWFDCNIEESPKVRHYIPDLLVSTYTTDSPIDDVDVLNANTHIANLVQAERGHSELETYIDYKHAEVVGNPAVVGFNTLADSSDFFCWSVVKVPYFPYFLSGNDPFWSSPSLEHFYPQAILGLPKIKTNIPLGYWAPVYPRCGWGAHPYDAINAAVAAHRAASIVTGSLSAHIYISPGSNCGKKCWPPQPVVENNLSNHKFQMVFPIAADSGMVMGGSATWANGKNKNLNEQYAWTLWRPYTCCHKKGAFITSIDF